MIRFIFLFRAYNVTALGAPTNYVTATQTALTAAGNLPEVTTAEKVAKATALNNAVSNAERKEAVVLEDVDATVDAAQEANGELGLAFTSTEALKCCICSWFSKR